MAALVQQLLRQNDLGGFLEHVDLKWFAYETRLGSFTGGKWRYDKMAGAACTAENVCFLIDFSHLSFKITEKVWKFSKNWSKVSKISNHIQKMVKISETNTKFFR
jgi:hypothetical protein